VSPVWKIGLQSGNKCKITFNKPKSVQGGNGNKNIPINGIQSA
jgi:hypothetical protein